MATAPPFKSINLRTLGQRARTLKEVRRSFAMFANLISTFPPKMIVHRALMIAGLIMLTAWAAHAATFTVTKTADTNDNVCDADCSLREAIIAANNNPGQDTIAFSIGSGPKTISPTSALPTISESVIIDGTTQPGFAGSPIIELDGSN